MKRNMLMALLWLALVSSCSSPPPPTTPTATSSVTPTLSPTLLAIPSATWSVTPTMLPTAAPTATSSPMARPSSTVLRTATRTPTATLIPTHTPIPSSSYAVVGIPETPRAKGVRYSVNVKLDNTHIYRYRAHERDVEVFIEQENILTEAQERERADYCFQAWLRVWDIFGGYAFPFYECTISDRLGDAARGSSGLAPWSRFPATTLAKSNQLGWQTLMIHEIFHAWNFGHLPFDELWITEGMAQYYNYVLVDPNNALTWVRNNGATYQDTLKQKGIDTALVNVTREQNDSIAYYKGALVWYMLDVEISERTNGAKSLNNVLRRLYLQYGTSGIAPGPRPTAPPRQAIYDAIIAEAGSPDFFNAFFKNYIEGTADLKEWHNGLFKNRNLIFIPPHPSIK